MKSIFSLLIFQLTLTLTVNGQTQIISDYEQLITTDSLEFKIKIPPPLRLEIDPEGYYSILIHYSSQDSIKNKLLFTGHRVKKQFKTADEELVKRVEDYRIEFGDLTFKKLPFKHEKYECSFLSINAIKAGFTEYSLYLNPGKKYKYGIVFTLLFHGRQATEKELEVFKQVTNSFTLIRER